MLPALRFDMHTPNRADPLDLVNASCVAFWSNPKLTILKHTQPSTLDSLLLLGVCSNALQYGTRYENRTRLSALKGQRPNR